MFGNHREISGRDRKCSQWFAGVEEFRSWFLKSPQKDPSKLLHASNDGKVEWNTTRYILPVEFTPVCQCGKNIVICGIYHVCYRCKLEFVIFLLHWQTWVNLAIRAVAMAILASDLQYFSRYGINSIELISYQQYTVNPIQSKLFWRISVQGVPPPLPSITFLVLTLEGTKGRGDFDPLPSNFLALNFCSLADCQKLWLNCSLFVRISFDPN